MKDSDCDWCFSLEGMNKSENTSPDRYRVKDFPQTEIDKRLVNVVS